MSNLKPSNDVILAIDPSGEHLAYTFISVDLNANKAVITDSGMIWTKGTFTRGQRFEYMLKSLEWLMTKSSYTPTKIITEQFFINPRLRMGVAVIPIINGFIEMLCSKHSIEYNELPPPSWRKELNIKPVYDAKGKRDYKTPTKQVVENTIKSLPATVLSNVTLKERATPHDLTDSLAIGIAFCYKNNIKSISLNNNAFSAIIPNELNKLL